MTKTIISIQIILLSGCGWVPGLNGHCYPEKTMQASFINNTGQNVAVVACAHNPLIPANALLVPGDGTNHSVSALVERSKLSDEGSAINCQHSYYRNTTEDYEKVQIDGSFAAQFRLCMRDKSVDLPAAEDAGNAIVNTADPCPTGYKDRPAEFCAQ